MLSVWFPFLAPMLPARPEMKTDRDFRAKLGENSLVPSVYKNKNPYNFKMEYSHLILLFQVPWLLNSFCVH